MRAKRQSPPRGLVESSSYVGITQIRCKGRSCVLPLSLPHKLPCRMKFDTKYTPRAGACQAGTKHGILNLQRKKLNQRGEKNVKKHASIWMCGTLALCALLACAVSAAGLLYGTRWALLAPGALLGIAPGLAAAASGGRRRRWSAASAPGRGAAAAGAGCGRGALGLPGAGPCAAGAGGLCAPRADGGRAGRGAGGAERGLFPPRADGERLGLPAPWRGALPAGGAARGRKTRLTGAGRWWYTAPNFFLRKGELRMRTALRIYAYAYLYCFCNAGCLRCA